MQFCPADSEGKTRDVLGLGEQNTISSKELFSHLEGMGLAYEVASLKLKPRKCGAIMSVDGTANYKVYVGFDETNTFTRNFFVVVGADEDVMYIEQIYAYRAP